MSRQAWVRFQVESSWSAIFPGKVLDKKKFRKVNGGVCYLSKLKQVIFDNSLNDVTLRRYTFHKIVV